MKPTTLFACGIIAAAAGLASADVAVSTFTFSDLDSEYFTQDGQSGLFTARAGVATSGDVTRLTQSGATTAEYDSAFAIEDGSLADVVFEMSISNISSLSADGNGSFMIMDVDGDSVSGSLNGTWSRAFAGAPILFFNGTLSDVQFTAGGDGMFAGSDGLGFELTPFLLDNTLEGGIVQVSFGLETFFDESFSGFSSQFSGTIVPTPGGVALLALGGLGVVARRRK